MDSTRIVTDPDGNTDIWRATDLEFLDFWERTTQLGELFRQWRVTQSDGDAVPRTEDFDRQVSRTEWRNGQCAAHYLPDLFHADAEPSAPADFLITAPSTGVKRKHLSGLFRPILRDALFSDLMLCLGTRAPLYQQIYQKVSGDTRCYVRLLLPTADDQGNIRRIYGISRPLYAEQELVHWSAS